jgi:hypothetical protein
MDLMGDDCTFKVFFINSNTKMFGFFEKKVARNNKKQKK